MIVAPPESPSFVLETPPSKRSAKDGAAGSSLKDDTRGVPLLSSEFGRNDDESNESNNDMPGSMGRADFKLTDTVADTEMSLPLYYRDNWAAFVFIFHVFVIFCLAVTSQASFHSHGSNASSSTSAAQAGKIVSGVVLLVFLSGVISWAWLRFLMAYAQAVISCMLWTMTGAIFFMSIVYFVIGFAFFGVLFLLLAIFGFFYALGVQNRIPFASSNLRIACLGVAAYSPELVYVGFGAMLAIVIWVLIWAPAYLNVVGATPAGKGGHGIGEILMLVSFFWGCQVCVNVAHVTTSGTIASWWFGRRSTGPATGAGSGMPGHKVSPAPLAKSTIALTGGEVAVDMDASGDNEVGGFVPPNPILSAADGDKISSPQDIEGGGVMASAWASTSTGPQYAPLEGLQSGTGGRTGYYAKARGRRITVKASLRQALTTSFGSICIGSFVVALLQTLRAVINGIRERLRHNHYDNDGYGSSATAAALVAGGPVVGSVRSHGQYHPHVETFVRGVLCFADWAVLRLERIMEYFNKWAFVYVAVYGHDFKSSGIRAYRLFRDRGWTTIVNDDLIGNALSLGGVVTGGLVGLIGWSYGSGAGLSSNASGALGLFGILSGYGMCAVLMHGLITSSVASIFVCFAHDPDAFKEAHPSLYAELLEAWLRTYGPIMNACGYVSNMHHNQLNSQQQRQHQRSPPPQPPLPICNPSDNSLSALNSSNEDEGNASMGTESAFFDSAMDSNNGAEQL